MQVEELNLPLKRNQNYVMKYFMQYRSDVAQVIDQPPDKRLVSTELLIKYMVKGQPVQSHTIDT